MNELFPDKKNVDYTKLKLTEEGKYSITKKQDSQQIFKHICDVIYPLKPSELELTDLTGNVGGDTINFALHFKLVRSIEISDENFEVLKNNVRVYDLKNIQLYHDDSLKIYNWKTDILYIDAPWGGPNYKLIEMNNLDLYLGTKRLDLFLKKILKESWKPSYIFLKVPRNFTFFRLKTLPNIEKIYKFKIRSFYLIGLKTNL